MPRPLPVTIPAPSRALSRLRVGLPDGAATTLHVASYDRAATRVRVVAFERPTRLVDWCRAAGASDAIVGGFFSRRGGVPLGELWASGRRLPSLPFDAPWDARRACLQVEGGELLLARRAALARPSRGDLLQAGPLLVDRGRALVEGDREGFSAGARQFDSDITLGRYPRAALVLAGARLLAVVCDGRSEADAGLTLGELAGALVELGARTAINLDGGGSASLVSGFALRNRPREEHGIELAGGRPIATALALTSV